jgi:hypothetical protein
MRRAAMLGLCLHLLLGGALWAQVNRGTITGTVKDMTGAIVPDVTINVTNVETGSKYVGITNELGIYSVLDLPIGNYSVQFSRQGFKSFERSGITLAGAQVAKIDTTLEVGGVSETVKVTDDAPLLETQTATAGTRMKGIDLTKLPLSVAGGRDVSSFAFNVVPTVNGSNNMTSVANSQTVSKIVMVDGTDADAGLQGNQSPPGMEAVQEFQVQMSGISAEAAGTGGGAFAYELKSGTNKLHGSAFGFLANEALNANTWDNNYWKAYCTNPANAGNGQCSGNHERPRNRFNDWGFSAGGPIWKNHTFIFGAFERYDQTDLRFSQNSATVPTNAFLNGDFSALLDRSKNFGTDSAGNTIYKGAIFNPATGNVFVGNIIPSSMISPQSMKIVDLYKKYYQPLNGNLTNNFNSPLNGVPLNKRYNFDLKVDHNFSEKNHFSASVNYSRNPGTGVGDSGLWMNGSSDPGPLNRAITWKATSRNFRIIDSHGFTPKLLNVLAVNYNESFSTDRNPHLVDNQALGFTASDSNSRDYLPQIYFGGANGINETPIGTRFNLRYGFYQYHFKDTVSWVKGRHTFKFGGEFVALGANDSPGQGQLQYSFSSMTGVPSALATNQQISPYIGFGFANFLLGDVSSALKSTAVSKHGRRKSMNFFAQDDIKVNSKLTLNASLRWDINLPWHEINGIWANFDPNAQNSSWVPYKGAWAWAKDGSDTFEKNNNFHEFGPHFGAAYQLTRKLVARGAWGLFYVPLGINQWGALPYGGGFGYVGTNTVNNSSPTQIAFEWDQTIYPGVYVASVRDVNANVACSRCVTYVDPNNLHLGRTQNWNFGVQYELDKTTIIDVSYFGNIGHDLHDGSLNPLNYPTVAQYQPLLQSGHADDWIQNQAAATKAGVTWLPWAVSMRNGWGGYNAYAAISPYPQVKATGPILYAGSPLGSSGYKALVTEIKRRGGSGLVTDLSYTLSRATGNTANNYAGGVNGGNMEEGWILNSAFQDPYAYQSFADMISPVDITHQFKGYITYELPFGRGRKWLSTSSVLNYLVGGWTLGTQVHYRSGMPMSAVRPAWWNYPGWSATFANYNKGVSLARTFNSLNLANLKDPSNLYFDPSAFSDQTYGTFGNQQPYWSEWKGWGYSNEDLSVVKNFGFGSEGRYRLTLRGEFFNIFNRHHWNNPNAWATNATNFGAVTGVYGNRSGQIGARFEW